MARAHGKVILLGEHAVVYGIPAIAASIERGAVAHATESPSAMLRLSGALHTPADGSEIGRAFSALLDRLRVADVSVDVSLELPPGCGLGASAALGIAIARSVLELRPEANSEALELEAANAWEAVFHGSPSGVDTAAAARPGCIFFRKGEPPTQLQVPRSFQLAVAVAGPPASTRAMVDHVAKLRQRRPEVVGKGLSGIEALVGNAKLCIEAGDLTGLGRLLDLNQMLLSGLFLSTEGIERACHLARRAGALGAKLTGAGGGGAVIALCDAAPDSILHAWREAGIECFCTSIASVDQPLA